MRYLVLRSEETEEPGGPGDDGLVNAGLCARTDRAPVPCRTRGEAEAALREWYVNSDGERDWSVWELVDGEYRQRSVVFKDSQPEIQG